MQSDWQSPEHSPPPTGNQQFAPGPITNSNASTLAWMTLGLGLSAWIFAPMIAAIGALVCAHLERTNIREGRSHPDGMILVTIGGIAALIQVGIGALGLLLALGFFGLIFLVALL